MGNNYEMGSNKGPDVTNLNESINMVDDNALDERGESALKDLKETTERIKTKLENGSLTNLDNNPTKKEEIISFLKTGYNLIKTHLSEILLAGGAAAIVVGVNTIEYDPAYIDRMLMSLQTGVGLAEATTGFLLMSTGFANWTEKSRKEAKERKQQKRMATV